MSHQTAMHPKLGRNDPCHCGSGRKFKQCCQGKTEAPPTVPTAAPQSSASPTPADLNGLVALFHAGRYAELESQVLPLIARYPEFGILWKIVGAAYQMQGKDALPALRRATELLPDDADAHNNLGNLLRNLRQFEDAAASCRRALALRPDYAEAHSNLANALKDLGQLDAALASYCRAVQCKPDYAIAHFNLANLQRDLGQFDAAAASYRRALELEPKFAKAHSNLGHLLSRKLGRLDEARASYRRVLELEPNWAEAHVNLGNIFKDAGDLDQALACFRRAVALDPNHTQSRSNLLYALSFHPAFDEQAICAEAAQFAPAARQARWPTAGVSRTEDSPRRRLRIGYVSPDFRNHCQSLFTIPLLSNHDHGRFEIYCYADLPQADPISQRLASYADAWRSTYLKSDAQLAEMIASDGIDILVDLTMHMDRGRPLLFAGRAAPVQVAWLAYPGTTGIAAIDYRLTDPWLDPPERGGDHYTEISIRLADTFWCYDPLVSGLLPNDLPALSSGSITFGCLNNFCKVSDDTLRRWGQVMMRVPGSRLILMAAAGQHRQKVLEILGQAGVAAQRIEFVEYQPRAQYLQLYHRLDICLDTLPYNGHTTSLDAYWMGVPVVTQVGGTVVGRAGWSQLNNLGLPELAAFDEPGFVEIAVALAADLARLGQLRQTLRGRLEASPLMDGKRFAGAMETVYTQIALG